MDNLIELFSYYMEQKKCCSETIAKELDYLNQINRIIREKNIELPIFVKIDETKGFSIEDSTIGSIRITNMKILKNDN